MDPAIHLIYLEDLDNAKTSLSGPTSLLVGAVSATYGLHYCQLDVSSHVQRWRRRPQRKLVEADNELLTLSRSSG